MHVSENGNTPFYGKNLDPNELMGKVIIMLSYESTSFLLTLLWVLNAAGYKKCLVVFFFSAQSQLLRGSETSDVSSIHK